MMNLPSELAQEVTSVLMNEEREVLHNWEVQQIYVKQKDATISQYVNETIITLRWYLVNNIIDDLKKDLVTDENSDNRETLEMVMAYLGLTYIFSNSLGRVLSRYN
jgi:DNA primase